MRRRAAVVVPIVAAAAGAAVLAGTAVAPSSDAPSRMAPKDPAAIAKTARSFLVAIADGDAPGTCALVDSRSKRQLARQSPGMTCERMVEMSRPTPQTVSQYRAWAKNDVKAENVIVSGDSAYVPLPPRSTLTLVRENGAWFVAAAQ